MDQQIKPKLVDIMIDIETTAIKPSQGQPWQGAWITSQHRWGCHTVNPSMLMQDPETVAWQKRENSANWVSALGLKIMGSVCITKQLLDSLWDEVAVLQSEGYTIQYWAKGSFDFDWLNYHADKLRIQVPWKYWECNDLRTLCNFFGRPVPPVQNAHDAYHDAAAQMNHLINLRKEYLK